MIKRVTLPDKGLYCITDNNICKRKGIYHCIRDCLEGGAKLVQYRNKNTTQINSFEEASDLLELCRSYSVPFIINDDIQLAKKVGADGVHLGIDDAEVSKARRILGSRAIIGASCYNDLDIARNAADAGASYLAFGRFYPSNTKPKATLASLSTLAIAKSLFSIPIVAIGGINQDNARDIVEAGADLIAVVEGVFGQADIKQAATAISAICS